jgi:hypothetical protein
LKSLAASCKDFCEHDQPAKGILQTEFYDEGGVKATHTTYECNIGVALCPIPKMYAMCMKGNKVMNILAKNRDKLNLDGL